MSELMREEFEAWAISQARSMMYSFPSDSVQLNGLGDYAIVWVQGAWLGWQASRAALRVELPAWEQYDDDMLSGAATAINDCQDSIHAAGVKTK